MLQRIAKTKAPFMKGQFCILFCTQSLAQYLAHSYFTNKYTEIKAIRHKLPNLFFLHQNIHMVTLFASSLSEILPSLAKINSYIYLLWCHNFWLHLDRSGATGERPACILGCGIVCSDPYPVHVCPVFEVLHAWPGQWGLWVSGAQHKNHRGDVTIDSSSFRGMLPRLYLLQHWQ